MLTRRVHRVYEGRHAGTSDKQKGPLLGRPEWRALQKRMLVHQTQLQHDNAVSWTAAHSTWASVQATVPGTTSSATCHWASRSCDVNSWGAKAEPHRRVKHYFAPVCFPPIGGPPAPSQVELMVCLGFSGAPYPCTADPPPHYLQPKGEQRRSQTPS